MFGQQFVQGGFGFEQLAGMDFNVGCLSTQTAANQRLVNHDAAVRQGIAFAFGTGGQQEGAHARCLTEAEGGDVGLDEIHGVVDGHTGGDGTTRRIDVEMDVLIRIFCFKEEELRDNQVGRGVIDRADEEDDPLFQQAGIDVVGSFAAPGLFDDHRDEQIVLDVHVFSPEKRLVPDVRVVGEISR